MEAFNEMNMEERRRCYTFREAASLSNHFQVALEVTSNARLLKGTTQAFVNDLRVIQRTPREQDRHDRLSRVECESDYEEPDDDEEEDAQTEKQVTRHSINEEKHSEMMAKKWRRATDAAVAFNVFLKRQASEEHG